ncbi:MAG: hypothetical protein LBR34_04405 [Prevotella sp.]|jgi:hypothetical protein|nr:hypothetical protein [Prevotella sp.]
MNKPELKAEVEVLLADVSRTHRYGARRIYALYNRVFGTDEEPQTCISCLIRKVNKLKRWAKEA